MLGVKYMNFCLRLRLVGSTKSFHRLGAHIVKGDIGRHCERMQMGLSLIAFEVQHHTALVAVEIGKARALSRDRRIALFPDLIATRGFDLDNISAKIPSCCEPNGPIAGRTSGSCIEITHFS